MTCKSSSSSTLQRGRHDDLSLSLAFYVSVDTLRFLYTRSHSLPSTLGCSCRAH
jgi:hypothetical protein